MAALFGGKRIGARAMILFILMACFLAKIRGNRIFPALKEKSLYPLYLVEILFWIAQISAWCGWYVFIPYASSLQTLYILALLFPIFRFGLYKTAISGCGMVVTGTLLNRIVIEANGGKMPIYPTLSRLTNYYREGALEASGDAVHCLMNESTRLAFLGDWIDVGFSIMSIGDLLIHGFVLITVYHTLLALNRGKTSCSVQ